MIETIMDTITHWVGEPAAILVLVLFVAMMYLVTSVDVTNICISIITLLLLPVLQHSQNRDGSAIQAKLDELIKANADARNELIGIDKKTEVEIEGMRCD